MTVYTATFPDGRTATRRSDRVYTHAAAHHDGAVSFHGSYARAVAAVGRHGIVVAVETTVPAVACVVCGGTRVVSHRRATTGEIETVACWRCAT